MRSVEASRIWLFLGWLLLSVTSSSVYAADRYWTLSNELKRSADRNYFLQSIDKRLVHRTTNRIEIELEERTETYEWRASLADQYREFSGSDEGLDPAHAQFLDADWQVLVSPKSNLAFGLNYQRDKADTDEFESLRVSREDQNVRRHQGYTTLQGQYSISERWTGSLSLLWQALRYDDAELGSLIPYNYGSAQLSSSYQVDERLTTSFRVSYSDYSPKPEFTAIQRLNAVSSQDRSVDISVSWLISEEDGLDMSVGYRESDYDAFDYLGFVQNIEDANEGGVASLSYRRDVEEDQLLFDVSRELRPSSDGTTVVRDRAAIVWVDKLSPYWSQRLNLSVAKDETQGQVNTDTDRLEVSKWTINYLLDRANKVSFTFQHRRSDEDGEEASGNGFYFTWLWTGEKQAF